MHFTAPRWRAEAGLAGGTALAEDAAGPSTKQTPGGFVGGSAVWDAAPRLTASLFTRLGVNGLSIESGGSSRSAGSVKHLDVGGAVEQRLGGADRYLIRASGDLVWLVGPDDLAPFRFTGGSSHHWGGEVGAGIHLTTSRPLFAVASVQAYRISANVVGNSLATDGAVVRVLLGVRYGR
jgi:hypothetical protein